MNSANADERRGELSLACNLALDVQLVRATIRLTSAAPPPVAFRAHVARPAVAFGTRGPAPVPLRLPARPPRHRLVASAATGGGAAGVSLTRGSGPICSRVGAPPRMSSMPQPHLVRCVIRDTPA